MFSRTLEALYSFSFFVSLKQYELNNRPEQNENTIRANETRLLFKFK